MIRPILTIRVPGYMAEEDMDDIGEAMRHHLDAEYHVIVYSEEDYTEIKFEVLNAEQLTEKKLKKLMKLI